MIFLSLRINFCNWAIAVGFEGGALVALLFFEGLVGGRPAWLGENLEGCGCTEFAPFMAPC